MHSAGWFSSYYLDFIQHRHIFVYKFHNQKLRMNTCKPDVKFIAHQSAIFYIFLSLKATNWGVIVSRLDLLCVFRLLLGYFFFYMFNSAC